MSFPAAVTAALSQYAKFSGRSRRSEYWWFALFNLVAYVVAWIIDGVLGTSFVDSIFALALLLPNLAIAVRRLHDTGRTGWWILIGLVPLIGFIVLLVFYVGDSESGTNQYGPSPKYAVPDEGWSPAQA